MKRVLLIASVVVAGAALAAAAVAAPAEARNGVGPPAGTIYAFDQVWQTVRTPTSLPNRGPFDVIYRFPDCPTCASVAESAPGTPGYNGGRWKVVDAYGIDSQLTNADDVVAQASMLVDTSIRFVCPLMRT